MERRGFLQKLGIGAISVPVIVKSLGDQKAKAYHNFTPEIKPYKNDPDSIDSCYGSTIACSCVASDSDDQGYFLYDMGTGQKIWRPKNNSKWKGTKKWQR